MFIHGGCNIRRTNCFEKQIQRIKLYHLNYKEQYTLLLLLLFIINIFHGKQRLSLNNDRHQYQQQNEQPSLTLNL